MFDSESHTDLPEEGSEPSPTAFSYRHTEEGYQSDYDRVAPPLPTAPAAPSAPVFRPSEPGKKPKARFSTVTLICCLIASIVLSGMTSAFVTAAMLSSASVSANNTGSSRTGTSPSNGVGIQSDSKQGNVNVTISDESANFVEAVAAKVTPSVVGVTATYTYSGGFFRQSEDITSQGSGVIYSSDGYIITNKHVVDYAISYNGSVQVYLPEDPGTAIDAEVVGFDAAYDLAVLKIDRTGLNAVTIGSSADLTLGQHVVAVGNPGGMEFMGSVSVGYLSGLSRTITVDTFDIDVIQTDAAINPGNSGGALVDSEGRLIGITNAKIVSEDFEGMGFAIPVDAVVSVCKDLITNSSQPMCYIGVQIDQTYSSAYLQANGYPAGIVVSTVIKDSPADQAGFRRYDIITEADGVVIDSYSKLINVLQKHTIGEPMTVKIYRSGKTVSLTVTPIASNG